MRITVLVENTAVGEELGAEHGLSLFIETDRYNILFDMGQSDLFEKNAKLLEIDLSKVDFAVLSHGHYDHGGGLEHFLRINERAPIYLSPHAFEEHYHGKKRYIGLDPSLKKEKRLNFVENTTEILPQITLFPRLEKQEIPILSGGLTRKEEDVFLEEDFRHEQYMMIEEKGKRVLFSGCSHRGVLNICKEFCPDILIGGFHFSKLGLDERLEQMTEELSQLPIRYYTCHCTGKKQYEFMKQRMYHLSYLAVGDILKV